MVILIFFCRGISFKWNPGVFMHVRNISLFSTVIYDSGMHQSHTLAININLWVSMSGCWGAKTFSHCQTKLGLTGLDFPKTPCWSVDLITVLLAWLPTCYKLDSVGMNNLGKGTVASGQSCCVSKSAPADSQSGPGERAVYSLCWACFSAVISGVSLIGGN